MASYVDVFSALTGKKPFPYQERTAELICARRHTVIQAPTGAGKTLAVLAPYLLYAKTMGLGPMIYVLPLRTLVEAVSAEAAALAKPFGLSVAVQTGECADAEYFCGADIIVTTYDQLLSGLLGDPYGLSTRLWNINAAAMAGKLVVFDEFHLMEPARAFTTALFGATLFKDLCTTVWMTATATSALTKFIYSELNAEKVELSEAERKALFEGRQISRRLRRYADRELNAAEILAHQGKKTLVVVNTVKKAQALYEEVNSRWPALLLHSRFFPEDRIEKQRALKDASLVIATQVIEAGVDISCEVLLTEEAPVNSIVQRAGRCARFPGESGTIFVYRATSDLPYSHAEMDRARATIADTDQLDPQTCAEWVELAHAREDQTEMARFRAQLGTLEDFVAGRIERRSDQRAAEYIRPSDDTVRLFILDDPTIGPVEPQARQSLQIRRTYLNRYPNDRFAYREGQWERSGTTDQSYLFALPRHVARYDKNVGLQLGLAGDLESPVKTVRGRPGWSALREELWDSHTKHVVRWSLARLRLEGLPDTFLEDVRLTAEFHDLGKLLIEWQNWADTKRVSPAGRALAHTNYDYSRDKNASRPPGHAGPSALYGGAIAEALPDERWIPIMLAVLSHHGGTLEGLSNAGSLHKTAPDALRSVALNPHYKAMPAREFHPRAEELRNNFYDLWRRFAILVRVLRLSDQQATADVTNG